MTGIPVRRSFPDGVTNGPHVGTHTYWTAYMYEAYNRAPENKRASSLG